MITRHKSQTIKHTYLSSESVLARRTSPGLPRRSRWWSERCIRSLSPPGFHALLLDRCCPSAPGRSTASNHLPSDHAILDFSLVSSEGSAALQKRARERRQLLVQIWRRLLRRDHGLLPILLSGSHLFENLFGMVVCCFQVSNSPIRLKTIGYNISRCLSVR